MKRLLSTLLTLGLITLSLACHKAAPKPKTIIVTDTRVRGTMKAAIKEGGATSTAPPSVALGGCSSPGALSYSFYQGSSATGPFTFLGTEPSCSYTVLNLAYSTTYYFTATALNIAPGATCPTGTTCESANGNVVQAITPAAPATIPNPPTGLTVVSITANNVQLQWGPPVAQAGVTPVSTTVYMCYASGCPNPPWIAEVQFPTMTYTANCTYAKGRCWFVLRENSLVNGKVVTSGQSNVVKG
jgi:hypothetical protein